MGSSIQTLGLGLLAECRTCGEPVYGYMEACSACGYPTGDAMSPEVRESAAYDPYLELGLLLNGILAILAGGMLALQKLTDKTGPAWVATLVEWWPFPLVLGLVSLVAYHRVDMGAVSPPLRLLLWVAVGLSYAFVRFCLAAVD